MMPIAKRHPKPAEPAARTPLRKVTLKNPVLASGPSATSEKSKTFAIADARAKLAEIFDYVTSEQARCYVRGGDMKKTRFITFDYRDRYMAEPVMDITINGLKSHFSTYSTLVRLGMCFRVSRRTSNQPVFMRRFTRYNDPLDAVMTEYIERRARKAVEDALLARSEGGIEKALRILQVTQENDTAEVLEEIKRLSTGIGRMAVNRHPFRDVPLRKDVIVVGDDE